MSQLSLDSSSVLGKAARKRRFGFLRIKRNNRFALILLILVLAGFFRFYDQNWDESKLLHPDERYVTVVTTQIKAPRDFAEFLDPGKSPINPYNTDWGRTYVYGTLPLFIVRNAAEWLDAGCAPIKAFLPRIIGQVIAGAKAADCGPNGFSLGYTALVGRFWSALADTLSVLLIYLLGSALFGKRAGLLAAFLGACTVFSIQIAHFYTVDSSTNFFTLLALYFSARIAIRNNGFQPAKHPSVYHAQPANVLPETEKEPETKSNPERFSVSISVRPQFFRGLRRKIVGSWWFFPVLAGISSGLALANKPSSFLLIVIVTLSIFIGLVRDRQPGLSPVIRAMSALVIAGGLTFMAFRVAQPYAFVGSSESEYARTRQDCAKIDPKADMFMKLCNATVNLSPPLRSIFTISSRWVKPLSELQGVVDGDQDMPYSQQWANRTGYLFPLTNLIFWGTGLPLGITSLLGVLYMLWRLLKGRRYWAYLIPIVWVLFNFLYYSNILGKTMRYLLPIYPILSICAAVFLLAGWRNLTITLQKTSVRLKSSVISLRAAKINAGLVLVGLVCAGNLIWAFAYFSIYTAPVTRLEASRWFMNNVPSAISILWESPKGKPSETQLFVKEINIAAGNNASYEFRLNPADISGSDTPENTPIKTSGQLSFRINHAKGNGQITADLLESGKTLASSTADNEGAAILLSMGNVQLTANQSYQLVIKTTGLLQARTTSLASEHWDDAVPMSVVGKDPNWLYNWLKSSTDGQIQNYGTDSPQKLQSQLNWLDEADYLTLSSNRLYASIPRLPWRYPATVEYYRALFNGELGFELVADFQSFPRIGPFTFNDQEMPQILARGEKVAGQQMGILVPYPYAEEAFSVYDHPRVLVFRKTSAYSRQFAEKILGKYDLARLVVQTPAKAATSPHGLVFDEITQKQQNDGGGWQDIFPKSSPLNQSEILAWLAWLILAEILGLAAYPLIAHTICKNGKNPLADTGWAASKILGLLLIAVSVWWLASAKLVAFERGPIWGIIITFALFGCITAWKDRRQLIKNLGERLPFVLAAESIFLIAFIAWTLVRAGNPDLWHPVAGGEKPMDFAYLNGILRSSYFPPIDPWFANGYINYYYFGFVLVGTPVKALGIEPSVAYNLIIPLLFALTAAGAFSIATTFLFSHHNKKTATQDGSVSSFHLYRNIIAGGVLASIFTVLMGNIDQINTLLPALQRLGGVENGTQAFSATIQGIGKWLSGVDLPVRPEWFYWNATRLTPLVPIAEFPQFTFLYADLHAHMMAMPLAMLSILLALALASGTINSGLILFSAIVVAMLWPTNSWDYPVHLVLACGSLLLGGWESGRRGWRLGKFVFMLAPLYVIATRILVIPYTENFGSAYNNIEPWTTEHTPLWTYLTINLAFIFPITLHLAFEIFHILKNTAEKSSSGVLPRVFVGALGFSLIAGVFLGARNVPIGIIATPIIALSLVTSLSPGLNSLKRLYWLLIAGAIIITLFVEVFTLSGDIGRMNTFFKFYIQVWVILASAASVSVVLVAQHLRNLYSQIQKQLKESLPSSALKQQAYLARMGLASYAIIMSSLIFLGMLYPAFGIPAKIKDRYAANSPQGLNGEKYMIQVTRQEGGEGKQPITIKLNDDLETIKWLRENIKGTPNIFEGTTGGFQYRWGNRISIYTGLPAVIGWEWHQRQQRAALSDSVVFDRNKDVSEFYNTANIERALVLIRRYQVRYIVVGDMERAYYDLNGLSKFSAMEKQGLLKKVYANSSSSVYQVLEPAF